MSQSPSPASHLGDFTVDPGFAEPPRRRPGAIVTAGIAMLAFGGLIVLRLTVQWTTHIIIEGRPLDSFLRIPQHQWEPIVCVIAATVLLLAVLVLRGGHRARFAAIAVMGGLLIEEAIALSTAVYDATVYDDHPTLVFFGNAIHILGLGLAVTAVALLATSRTTRWFDTRQLDRSPVPEPVSRRPRSLVVVAMGLTAVALYKTIGYVIDMSTATGNEYVTRTYLLLFNSLYELPSLIILVFAVVGLCFGSGLARAAAYIAAGSYCYEGATGMLSVLRHLILGPNLGDLTIMSLLEPLLVATVTVASLIALSRPRTVAWFRARRGHASDRAVTG